MSARDYNTIATQMPTSGTRQERMERTIEVLWAKLKDTGVSWVGFYLHEGRDELALGPREPTPACSPIELHGACGCTFTNRRPLVIYDVRELKDEYIACDPRDRSEVVVPLLEPDGTCWGVLDLDSHDVASFDRDDVRGLEQVLKAAGLTH